MVHELIECHVASYRDIAFRIRDATEVQIYFIFLKYFRTRRTNDRINTVTPWWYHMRNPCPHYWSTVQDSKQSSGFTAQRSLNAKLSFFLAKPMKIYHQRVEWSFIYQYGVALMLADVCLFGMICYNYIPTGKITTALLPPVWRCTVKSLI